jgi:hypothetical protein
MNLEMIGGEINVNKSREEVTIEGKGKGCE